MKPNRDGQQSGRYRGGRRQDGPNRGPRRDGNRDHRGYGDRDGNRDGNRGGYRDGNRDGNRGGYRDGNRDHGNAQGREHGHENREPREGRGWVEVSGRTVEEAREEALRRFNTQPDLMRIEVLDEGSRGFLGLGSKPARLKISLKPSASLDYAQAVLERMLRGMGLPDTVSRKKDSEGNTVLDVAGPSGGILIGRHGQTLESLQYLVSKIVQRTCDDERSLIVIDIEGYRERQTEKLRETALNFAKKAEESGQTVSLQPMNSRDRRVVHLTLRDHAEVTTQSTGEGLRRRVMIVPKHPKVTEEIAAQTPAEHLPEAVVGEPGNVAPPPAPANITEEADSVGNLVPPEGPAPDDNIGNHV